MKLVSNSRGSKMYIGGFPFTRHMMKNETIYWRCVQFRAFRCPARHRQRRTTGMLELVHSEHNHGPIQNRRKRGTLKELMRQRAMGQLNRNSDNTY
uniref:FLYWCH-type domain-containing protein n=1 Tax=Anopheles christyi TaxID=43041 RepID=A0A182JNL1_9DIPT